MMSSHFHPDMDGSSDIHLKSNVDHNSDMMLMETSNELNDVNDLKSSMNIIELNSTMNSMMDDLDTEPINPPIDTTSPKINLKTNMSELPYLNSDVIEDFADLKIKSEDGLEIQINPWLLISCSDFMKHVLYDSLFQDQETIISTNLNYTDLKNFQEFIMRGVLPCPKSDILSNQMDPDIESVFACLGVDLKYLMEYFYIKKETKFDNDDDDRKEDSDSTKPAYKYKHLVIIALSPTKKLALDDIFKSIKKEFPYYKGKGNHQNWQKGVRECLSLHKKLFKKVKKSGKTLWMLNDKNNNERVSHQNNVRIDYDTYQMEPEITIKQEPGMEENGVDDYFVDNFIEYDDDDDPDYQEDIKPIKPQRKYNKKPKIKKEQGVPFNHDGIHEEKDFDANEDGSILPLNSTPKIETPKTKCFMCGYCEVTFLNAHELKDHVVETHGKNKNKCQYCEKVFNFSKPSALRTHLKVFHGKFQSSKCGFCETTFSRLRDLKSHVREIHGTPKNKCSYCEKCFSVDRPNDLKRHVQGVHEKTLHLKCDFCEKAFSLEAHLKGHIRSAHTGLKKDLKCKFCQEVFSELLQLKTHTENVHQNATEWRCDFCDNVYERNTQLNAHIHKDHKTNETIIDDMEQDPHDFFQRYRGLWNFGVGIKQEHFSYVSFEKMLEYQMQYQNQFTINIPPEDFSVTNFVNFEYPKPIEELAVVPENQYKISSNGRFVCEPCKKTFNSTYLYKEHFAQMHSMHFHCPYERCDFGVLTATLRQFAVHIHYHENNHRQLMHYHECIACGLQTPYMERVQNHLKTEGIYHDNQCPRCPERFYSRQDMVNHMTAMNHTGFRCGLCGKVFDTLDEKLIHRKECSTKQLETTHVCDECGQVFPTLGRLNAHVKMVHVEESSPCETCGKIFRSMFHLEQHVKKVHQKTPCTICGKLFGTKYKMKTHMISVHTEDHLKPFICSICHKGFVLQKGLDQHMNIHTGNKPYKCDYCGRGFADDGNRRMHQKTTHEGYKRGSKAQS